MSDSLSALQALACGPLRQRTLLGSQCWESILQIMQRIRSLAFVFVFAHCGMPRGDAADKLAAYAHGSCDALRDDQITHTPLWWVDEARRYTRPLQQASEAEILSSKAFRSELLRGLNAPSPFVSEKLHLTPSDARLLAQLRCGCCARFGGWKNEESDDCRVCGSSEALHRREAIRHIFACPQPSLVKMRQELDIQEADALFTKPVAALTYARQYISLL